jgi:NAD(P)H-dependent FMN reductase
VHVATFCGSHHPGSTNAAALARVAARLQALGAEVVDVATEADAPAFRPALVDTAPPTVAAIRRAFETADAVVFAVPEYAGGLPGWVKNTTDWMVGSGSLYERPVAVVSAATMGGRHSIQQLSQTLTWQGAYVIATLGIVAPLTKTSDDGAITDEPTCERLDRLADVVSDAVAGGLERCEALRLAVLEPLGIDPYDRTT